MAPSEMNWMERARCNDNNRERWMTPDAWFPDSRDKESWKRPREICNVCPVKEQCELAGVDEKFGIWAGELHAESSVEEKQAEHVPAFGSMRRLQSLAVLGWNGKDVSADIRRYAGMVVNPRRLDALRAGSEETIPEEIADAIARAFKHMGSTLNSGNSSSTTIAFARGQGWMTPREWRGFDIDDPDVAGPSA